MSSSYLNDGFFSRLETLALNLKKDLRGYFGGKHLVKTYGQTVEFSDFREYELGDDIRRIDWNLFSRFEKYFIKLFTDERQMHVQIFLDCSSSMYKNNPDKARYAISVAAALGFLAIHNMDKVSFGLIYENEVVDPFGLLIGKTAFFKAISDLENIEFDGESYISDAIISYPDVTSNNGLSVIISDFLTENDYEKAVDYLTYKKKQVLLVQTLSDEEIEPVYDGRVNLLDSESLAVEDTKNIKIKITKSLQYAYSLALNDYINNIRSFAQSRDQAFISVNTNEKIESVLFKKLLEIEVMK